jgi:hypothetical protein
MNIRTLALVLGSAAAIAAGGAAGIACSSSTSPSGPSGGMDSGSTDGTVKADTGNTGGDDGGTPVGDDGGGGGPDCGKIPSIHPDEAGTIFCGFTDAAAPNDHLYCTTGTQCCLGGRNGNQGFFPEDCVAFGSACDNPADGGLPKQCGQPSDCALNHGGAACCLRGATPQMVTGCGYYKAQGGEGLFCEQGPGCAAGEVAVCTSNNDCPSGQTCTAFKYKLWPMGFCQ